MACLLLACRLSRLGSLRMGVSTDALHALLSSLLLAWRNVSARWWSRLHSCVDCRPHPCIGCLACTVAPPRNSQGWGPQDPKRLWPNDADLSHRWGGSGCPAMLAASCGVVLLRCMATVKQPGEGTLAPQEASAHSGACAPHLAHRAILPLFCVRPPLPSVGCLRPSGMPIRRWRPVAAQLTYSGCCVVLLPNCGTPVSTHVPSTTADAVAAAAPGQQLLLQGASAPCL